MVEEKEIRNCKNCECVFTPSCSKQIYCCRSCAQTWRNKNVYKDKYTVTHRSLSPRNFIKALLTKKSRDRKLEIEYLMGIYEEQEGRCALTGRMMTYQTGMGRIPTNISIDRIDSNIGYEVGNIQLVCLQANLMKGQLTMEELNEWCSDIVNKKK